MGNRFHPSQNLAIFIAAATVLVVLLTTASYFLIGAIFK